MTTATHEPSLKDLADQEANLAEAEAENLGIGASAAPAADGFMPHSHQPGDNGIATQKEQDEPAEPTQQELRLADDVVLELEDRAHDMSGQEVVDLLIATVGVHHKFRVPEIFTSDSEDADVYAPADCIAEIARFLTRGCRGQLEVNPNLLVFYFRDHEKWTKHGKKVPGTVKRFDGFHQHHNEGQLGAVIVNYHFFKTLNPRQKVFHVYHLLREMDAGAKRRAPDYQGYFEEPGLFGAGVHEEMVEMARSFVRDAAEHVGDVHQLSILAGVYSED